MKWILVVIFSSYNGHTSISFQEFNTNTACVEASKKIIDIKKNFYYSGSSQYACVEKG